MAACGAKFWLNVVVLLAASPLCAQEHVSFITSDGWTIHGDLYGSGDRGLILAHGGRFEKSSWAKQAPVFAAKGFRVLAIDLRNFGLSKDGPNAKDSEYGSPLDILAAAHYLRGHGAKTVAAIGASMGGDAVADALVKSQPGDFDRVVFLAGGYYAPPDKLTGRKLFIIARDDTSSDGPRLPRFQASYDKAPQPKQLIILPGSAHAQFIFQTDQGERLMSELVKFLTAP